MEDYRVQQRTHEAGVPRKTFLTFAKPAREQEDKKVGLVHLNICMCAAARPALTSLSWPTCLSKAFAARKKEHELELWVLLLTDHCSEG